MKKTLLAAVTAATIAAAPAASAVEILFDVFKPGTATQIINDALTFDWSDNAAVVVKGAGPFGTPLSAGDSFEFLFQSPLQGFSGLGGPLTPLAGLNGSFASGGYQITAVASVTEVVLFTAGPLALFAAVGGTVSIFYDDATHANTQANNAAGTGFDDGVELYRGLVVGGTTPFGVSSPTNGSGSPLVLTKTLLLDPALVGATGNLTLALGSTEGSIFYPAGTASTVNYHVGGSALYPDYLADIACTEVPFSCDLLMRSDVSSRFVPEPGGLVLLGTVLFGLGWATRRRKRA